MNAENNLTITLLSVVMLKTSDARDMTESMLGRYCTEWLEGDRPTLPGFARNLNRALTQLEKAHDELSKVVEALQKEQRA